MKVFGCVRLYLRTDGTDLTALHWTASTFNNVQNFNKHKTNQFLSFKKKCYLISSLTFFYAAYFSHWKLNIKRSDTLSLEQSIQSSRILIVGKCVMCAFCLTSMYVKGNWYLKKKKINFTTNMHKLGCQALSPEQLFTMALWGITVRLCLALHVFLKGR